MMADQSGLEFLGWIFGGVTFAVMLTALAVVFAHVGGSLVLDAAPAVAAATR